MEEHTGGSYQDPAQRWALSPPTLRGTLRAPPLQAEWTAWAPGLRELKGAMLCCVCIKHSVSLSHRMLRDPLPRVQSCPTPHGRSRFSVPDSLPSQAPERRTARWGLFPEEGGPTPGLVPFFPDPHR